MVKRYKQLITDAVLEWQLLKSFRNTSSWNGTKIHGDTHSGHLSDNRGPLYFVNLYCPKSFSNIAAVLIWTVFPSSADSSVEDFVSSSTNVKDENRFNQYSSRSLTGRNAVSAINDRFCSMIKTSILWKIMGLYMFFHPLIFAGSQGKCLKF